MATKKRRSGAVKVRNAAQFPPDTIFEAVQSKRFLGLSRAAADIGEIATWDDHLLRDLRLLVPLDVQALYVPAGSDEKMVRLPMLLSGAGNDLASSMPAPFAAGSPRPGGVHLHWAMPDALLSGKLEQREAGSANRLGLPPLPDRWVVLRIVLPVGATQASVRGWVIEAERAVAVPLESWTEGSAASQAATPAGITLRADQLTGAVGGSVQWASVYDAVLNRFAFHDPLDDLAAIAPDGVDASATSYLVAGWWSKAERDPLDAARSGKSLDDLLDQLKWRRLNDWAGSRSNQSARFAADDVRSAVGLKTAGRFDAGRPDVSSNLRNSRAAAPFQRATFSPVDATLVEAQSEIVTSAFLTAADPALRFRTEPWQPRSTLIHGAVYGVPVSGPATVDVRPPAGELRVALGFHDDDVLSALLNVPGTTAEQRRNTERLLDAFTAQKINRLGSPEGITEIESYEHDAGFGSFPGGIDGTDRFVSGSAGGTTTSPGSEVPPTAASAAGPTPRFARPGGSGRSASAINASVAFARERETLYDLVELSAIAVDRTRHNAADDVLHAAEPRVVQRPEPRFSFPIDPMVAIQGSRRSLRNGHDGRASADGKLTCRWPSQVISEVQGVISGVSVLPSLGSGAIPPEVLSLAREVVLHDPYHINWLTTAANPGDASIVAIRNRLTAEAGLRFGKNGSFTGSTQVFATESPIKTAATDARIITDELFRYSLYSGADPDPVGVTAWSQPWIPLWLEWEIDIDSVAAPTLDSWTLGPVDFEPSGSLPSVTTHHLTGRSILTTGAATTLQRAITDWLAAEKLRDPLGQGEADEKTQSALSNLVTAVELSDVVTSALDGVRSELLGLAVSDGVHAPRDSGGVKFPAPVSAPDIFVAGTAVLRKARLLDAFGRVLDVPTDNVLVSELRRDPAASQSLSIPPRITRAARWRFDLVDAASPAGDVSALHARVDQLDPTLMVNPVAGFLLPDHLDESLEVFAVDGSPLGELLHEPIDGSVVWEIAAGRVGPPDAGPSFGLTPSQQSLGWFASGLVAADAVARSKSKLQPGTSGATSATMADRESALSSLLRAIDTTLWTVDSFAAMGSEHVAGLVGRPVAVVRAQLRLDLRAEDDLDLSDPIRAQERVDAEKALAAIAFPVRLGELTRTDDGLLGFFVDDDYSRFRLVDKTIKGAAYDSGRSRGQLGLLGLPVALKDLELELSHEYIVGDTSKEADSDTISLHLGQVVTLTLLMHPGGRVHATSGVLPRTSVALARDWVGAGLAALAPSLRTGPLLVETDLAAENKIRLPKVSVFGSNQAFLWRDTPATWRTDAILAATQTALLPDTPCAFREGWVRVMPKETEADKKGPTV
jgi:hypothetical protein